MAEHGVKAGTIAKPYGLRGEVQLILLPQNTEYLKEGTFLFIDMDGQWVPFYLEEVDMISAEQAIVKFEFIVDKDAAAKMNGRELRFDPKLSIREKDGNTSLLSLTGYIAIDEQKGELGAISKIIVQAANPLWLVQVNETEILIPATEDFVKKIDHKKQILYLDLPAGLTEV